MSYRTGLNQKGSITIELLIAFAMLVIVVPAVVAIAAQRQTLVPDMQSNNEALYRAQTMLEQARALSREDFDSVTSKSSETEYVGPLAYTKKLDVQDIDLFTKQATSTVTWQQGSRTLSIVQSTILTNPDPILGGGDTCSETVIGDWSAPVGHGTGDITSSEGATGLDAFNHKVYLTTVPSSVEKDDFYIFDVSDPDPPGGLPILGSLNIGDGLDDVRISGRYAYAVPHSSSTAQFMVIDSIDSANPTAVAWLDLTPGGITGYGNTIAYADNRAYVGLTKSTGAELKVVDVSDPLSPTVVGSLETDTAINQIVIDRDNALAYLALATTTSAQLWKISISNPASPSVLQKFFPTPGLWAGQGVALSKTTDHVFLGRQNTISSAAAIDLYALDTSDITTALGSVTQTKDDGFTRMVVRSGLLFASNNQPNLGFQVWDVSDPSNMTMFGSLNIQQASTAGMDCEGNYIFIGQRSNYAVQIIGPGPSAPSSLAVAVYDAVTDLPISSVASGASVYSGIEIFGGTGTPTGTVDFTLYTNKDDCTGPKVEENDVLLSLGTAVSSDYTTGVKSISYKVHYDGDSLYTAADSACMPLEVN